MRGNRVVRAFPIRSSEEFGNRPTLLGSRSVDVPFRKIRGRWQPGDRFLLATDALGQWFLLRTEQGGTPFADLCGLLAEGPPDSALADWIESRRNELVLRNDDVTLMVVDVDAR